MLNRDSLAHQAQQLVGQTVYHLSAKNTQAPHQTNCVTSIRYILKSGSRHTLPSSWIGDMPRVLVSECGYSFCQIDIGSLRAGDLVFISSSECFSPSSNRRSVVHVAMAVGVGILFHSSYERGGACLENIIEPCDRFGEEIRRNIINDSAFLIRYIDPRNHSLRKRFESGLLSFSVPKLLPFKEKKREEVESVCDVEAIINKNSV